MTWHLLLLLLYMVVSSSHAAVINVPADHATIQAAVTASSAGDEIRVADGTYTGAVTIPGTKDNLIIRSVNLHGAVIDGNYNSDYWLTAPAGADLNNVTIERFRIREYRVGGIRVDGPTSNNDNWKIRNNWVSDIGQLGIFVRGQNHQVTNNIVHDVGNRAEAYCIFSHGAGIEVAHNQLFLCGKNGVRTLNSPGSVIHSNIIYYADVCLATNGGFGNISYYNNLLYHCGIGWNGKHMNEDSSVPCAAGVNNGYTRFWHNTVYGPPDSAIAVGTNDPPTRCVDIRNNVFVTDPLAYVNVITEQTNLSQFTTINGNLYDTRGRTLKLYNDSGTGQPDYTSLAQLRANTPHEDNGLEAESGLQALGGALTYAPGSASLSPGLNLGSLGSPYGTQRGARGLTQTTPLVTRIPMEAVSSTPANATISRLADWIQNPAWVSSNNTPTVIFRINGGTPIEFDGVAFIGNGAPDDDNAQIDSFGVDWGMSATGPWTEFLTDGGNTYPANASWSFFTSPTPVTASYIRFRVISTFEPTINRVEVNDVFVYNVATFEEPVEPPELVEPPATSGYGPVLETCVTTQQAGTTGLVTVTSGQDLSAIVAANTDKTILIREGVYLEDTFAVGTDNLVKPYNCENVNVVLQGADANTIATNGWTISGLTFVCNQIGQNACLRLTGTGGTLRNSYFHEGPTAIEIASGAHSVVGNIMDGPGPGFPVRDLIAVSGSVSNTEIRANWMHTHSGNTEDGGDYISVDGVTSGPLTITENLMELPYGVGRFINLANNTTPVTITYNTMRGPFNQNVAASVAILLNDSSTCHAAANCPSHHIHHNYIDSAYTVEATATGLKSALGIKPSGNQNYASALIEFNIENNQVNGAEYNAGMSTLSNIRYRYNTFYRGAIKMQGAACTDTWAAGPNFLFQNNILVDTRITDLCVSAADWSVAENNFSGTIGTFNTLSTGNTTDTTPFVGIANTPPDFTVSGTHSQKGALTAPQVASAQIDDGCVLEITMAPYNEIFNHGPLSSMDADKLTVKYGGVVQNKIGASLSVNQIDIEMESCPASGASVSFDAAHGWCADSAGLGADRDMNAACTAVTAQAVTNNATATGSACDALFGGASGYLLCGATDTACAFNATLGGGTCRSLCDSFGRDCLGAMSNAAGSCADTGANHTCDTETADEICVCELPAATGVLTQSAYQFYKRWAGEGVYPAAPVSTGIDVYHRGFFTLRFLVKSEGGASRYTPVSLWARKCTPSCGSWTLVDTSSAATLGVYIANHPRRQHLELLANLMALGGSTFEADGRFLDAANDAVFVDMASGAATEIEYSLGVSSGGAIGNTIEFRLEEPDGTDLAYTQNPVITITRTKHDREGGGRN